MLNTGDDDMPLGRGAGIAFIVVLTGIYFSILYMIWSQRNKQAVYFKSPYMIILGGLALWFDSCINVTLNSKFYIGKDETMLYEEIEAKNVYFCWISIIDTMTFHYIAYLCIIFRGRRIFKIMRLEKQFLKKIYNLARENNSDHGSIEETALQATNNPEDRNLLEDLGDPMVPPEILSAEKIGRKLKDQEEKQEEDLKNSKEWYYIKWILKIVSILLIIGLMTLIMINPFAII